MTGNNHRESNPVGRETHQREKSRQPAKPLRQLGDEQLRAGLWAILDNDNDCLQKLYTQIAWLKPHTKSKFVGIVEACGYLWEHTPGILDKCQHVKSIRTRQHQSIAFSGKSRLDWYTYGEQGSGSIWYCSLLAGGLEGQCPSPRRQRICPKMHPMFSRA
jgi:hypothetical protein